MISLGLLDEDDAQRCQLMMSLQCSRAGTILTVWFLAWGEKEKKVASLATFFCFDFWSLGARRVSLSHHFWILLRDSVGKNQRLWLNPINGHFRSGVLKPITKTGGTALRLCTAWGFQLQQKILYHVATPEPHPASRMVSSQDAMYTDTYATSFALGHS